MGMDYRQLEIEWRRFDLTWKQLTDYISENYRLKHKAIAEAIQMNYLNRYQPMRLQGYKTKTRELASVIEFMESEFGVELNLEMVARKIPFKTKGDMISEKLEKLERRVIELEEKTNEEYSKYKSLENDCKNHKQRIQELKRDKEILQDLLKKANT